MALIREFAEKRRQQTSLHEEVEASYSRFERDGRTLLQIDTYGRSTRENPGKISQTIQFDEQGASQLYEIIKRAFNFD